MPGLSDMLGGRINPMDMKSLAGQMGMGSQMQAVGGPVQNMVGMPSPGGMDMLQQMGGAMGGGPPGAGPMGGPGMENPMLAALLKQPPPGVNAETSVGLKTLIEFSKMTDEDIIELVLATKPEGDIGPILAAIGEQLGRPALIEAAQMAEGGLEAEMFGGGEGMVG